MKNYLHQKREGVPSIIVIGAGFGGINFVRNLKDRKCDVILVDKHNYHQFQPLLYQVAISGLEPDSIVSPVRRLFNQSENVRFVMGRLFHIDQEQDEIELDVGHIPYDILVIATGSRTNFYGNENLQRFGIGLKDINDALNMRSWIIQKLEEASLEPEKFEKTHFVIAGAGPAGVEMAGALSEFCSRLLGKDYPRVNKDMFRITLIEGSGKVLGMMSEKAQIHALKVLEGMEIQVVVNALVKDFNGNQVTYIKDGMDHVIHANTLIWTAGVHCEILSGMGRESIGSQNRLLVDTFLKVKGTKKIYAIGDIAYLSTASHERGLPMVAQTAIQQARYLSKSLFESRPREFKYIDKGSMATIGMKNAVADINSIFFRGRIGWWLWSFVHLIAITGFRNRLVVGFNWLVKYLSYEKANQLIIRKVEK